MAIDLESLGLTEIIRLRERLADALVRKFERTLALAFTDVVAAGAPAGGGEGEAAAGRDQILALLAAAGGGTTVVTPAGGVLSSFASADAAATALVEVHRHAPARGLALRSGVHHGAVLTNGQLFSGESLRIAGRVAASAAPGEIRLTRQAYVELSSRFRLRCMPLPALACDGGRNLELMALHWREAANLPLAVLVEETGERLILPDRPIVTFGRLPENDVVLSLPDRARLQRISRLRHFELVREVDELYFHPLSESEALVDGQPVRAGERARVVPGTVVRLGSVMTLTFQGELAGKGGDDGQLQTIVVSRPPSPGPGKDG